MSNRSICRLLCVAIVATFGPLALAEETPIKVVETPPGKAPSDAVVLYDGSSTDAFVGVDGGRCTWESKDGVMTVGKGFIVSKLHFRDAQLHVEFMVPTEQAGNSGVYIHGHYELQISDTAGSTKPDKEMIGSLYRFTPPLVNAGRKAHEWQVYDIVFRAPRYNEQGKISEPGSVTAFLNGVLVQNGTTFSDPRSPYTPYVYKNTPYTARILESLKRTDTGPLYLQDHQSPVKYRSVWIRPLDDRAKAFE
jgi:hypothetical protein